MLSVFEIGNVNIYLLGLNVRHPGVFSPLHTYFVVTPAIAAEVG